MVDVAALPVLTGHKTARERFAGATRTWTCEGMMGDGKALQMGTSHELGQNFSKAFDITYTTTEGVLEYVWQTSWGVSTRLIGALVMGHGDDFGLRLPPALAPSQVVVLLIKEEEGVRAAAEALVDELRADGHRVRLDDRTGTSFGRRSVDWELKGVPVRVEIGPRDLAEGNVTVVTRHTREKQTLPLGAVRGAVTEILSRVGPELLAEGTASRRERTAAVTSLEEAIEAAGTGFATIPVGALGPDGEDRLAKHALSIRCLQRPDGSLAEVGDGEADLIAVVARSY
jgi:prolyl-tRNA synthetase